MATIYESDYYKLIIVPEDDPTNTDGTPLTFTEYRTLMAENMKKIDTRIYEVSEKNNQLLGEAKNYTEDLLSRAFNIDDSDSNVIGFGGVEGSPMTFNDGIYVSRLENGTFTTDNVTVNSSRYGDYLIRNNLSTNHFQIIYKPI